jgi:hypothetical protein
MITNAGDIHDDLRGQSFNQSASQMMNHAKPASRSARRGARKNSGKWSREDTEGHGKGSQGKVSTLALLPEPLRNFLWIAALLLISTSWAAGPEEAWVLLPEPKFMGHKVTEPLTGAKKTVLAAAKFTPYGAEFPTLEQWAVTGMTDEALITAGKKQATTWWGQLKPELIRDKKKVVLYARIQSAKIPAVATVLAPEFWQYFEGIFGPRMRVVMPNRSTVFVFPDVAIELDEYSKMVMQAWRSEEPKVSLEVFELSEKGLKAIGQFEEPQ